MSDDKLTKTTGALLVAVRDHVEQLIGGNHIDATQLRHTIEARQTLNKQLVGGGMSLRDAGKITGVSQERVRRDVSPKVTTPSPKVTPKSKPSPPKSSAPEEEREQQRWAATRNLIDGILLFDRHKPGDRRSGGGGGAGVERRMGRNHHLPADR